MNYIKETPHRRPTISPLRYPGGKGALYSRLRSLIKNSGLLGSTYVEPYAGGAGAALSLLVTGQVERVVINDLDPAIYAFWKTVVEEPAYLMSQIHKAKLDMREWNRQREIYLAADLQNPTKLGYATFYLNRTNRSGILNGGPIGGTSQNGNYKIDARFNRVTLTERIRILSLYKNEITVTSVDGLKVIKKYSKKSNIFIYADPPYFEKAGSLYLNAFQEKDHRSLAEILNSIPLVPWLLTYDNVSQVGDLYPFRRRRTFELSYSAQRVRKAVEVAVLSDSIADIGSEWL